VRYPDPSAFVDDPLVIRQWFCPECADLLGTDFCRQDDAPTWDMRLDLATFQLG
jgi:hypothetical protein